MAEESKGLTCAQLRDFHEQADALWQQWVVASNTTNPAEWDAAFASYTLQMENLRMAFGHPPGKPQKRP